MGPPSWSSPGPGNDPMSEGEIKLLTTLLLLIIGFTSGTVLERRHFRKLRRREAETDDVLVLSCGKISDEAEWEAVDLAMGSVVISTDYFKQFLSGIRKFIGGRMRSYESLLERARREAILRMKEAAIEKGALAILNVKLETSRISSGAAKATVTVEVLAYGTAVKPRRLLV